jgi:hypothetical protein
LFGWIWQFVSERYSAIVRATSEILVSGGCIGLLDPSNAEDADRICAMILTDDDSIDDGTESNEDYVEPREGDS